MNETLPPVSRSTAGLSCACGYPTRRIPWFDSPPRLRHGIALRQPSELACRRTACHRHRAAVLACFLHGAWNLRCHCRQRGSFFNVLDGYTLHICMHNETGGEEKKCKKYLVSSSCLILSYFPGLIPSVPVFPWCLKSVETISWNLRFLENWWTKNQWFAAFLHFLSVLDLSRVLKKIGGKPGSSQNLFKQNMVQKSFVNTWKIWKEIWEDKEFLSYFASPEKVPREKQELAEICIHFLVCSHWIIWPSRD